MKTRELIACVAFLVLVTLVVFNTRLLGSTSLWCDPRVQDRLAEKDHSVKQAMQQMQEALAQQEAMLRELTAEREASRELRKKIVQLSGGGSSSSSAGSASSSGGGGRRRRTSATADKASSSTSERLHDASAAVAAVREEPPLSDVDVLAGGDLKLVPSAIAVVVIAYNRPHYLDEALRSINASHPGGDSYPVYVSQDGENKGVADMARKHGARSLVHPRKIIEFTRGTYLSKNPGYAYLSVHYGWALRTLFGMGIGASRGAGSSASAGGGGPYAGVIILEEDIRVAADFFSYFSATAPLLESDPTLLCVSAFNDNGQDAYPGDARALHRSDFFPGLGWLLTRRMPTLARASPRAARSGACGSGPVAPADRPSSPKLARSPQESHRVASGLICPLSAGRAYRISSGRAMDGTGPKVA